MCELEGRVPAFFFSGVDFIQGMILSSHKFQQLGAGLHLLWKSHPVLETYLKTKTRMGAGCGNVTEVHYCKQQNLFGISNFIFKMKYTDLRNVLVSFLQNFKVGLLNFLLEIQFSIIFLKE